MNTPIAPLRYDLPREIHWAQVIRLIQSHGYTLASIGRAMGYKGKDPGTSVTRHVRESRRMPYAHGAALLALAEDTLSERELAGCVVGKGFHAHRVPARRDAGVPVRYPTAVRVEGLVRALMNRDIDRAQIARRVGTTRSTLTRTMQRGGAMATPTTLRLLEYAHRVLPPQEFARHVDYRGES